MPIKTEKVCGRCKVMKPAADYHVRNTPTGKNLHSYCKPCNRIATREWLYQISDEEYQSMIEAQRGLCAICGLPPRMKSGRGTFVLHVDHDHATGKVRGLLCTGCNQGIGMLGDSPERLEAAARYLRGGQ